MAEEMDFEVKDFVEKKGLSVQDVELLRKFDALFIESKNAQTVVLMLQSPEVSIVIKACEAIFKFAEKCDDNINQLLALGTIDPLVSLLSHQDQFIRRNAIMALGELSSNASVRKEMRKLKAVPSIIALLSPEEVVVCHEFASLALSFLAREFSGKALIFDHEGVEPLLRLLSSADPDVQKNSIECIFFLLQDYPIRGKLLELNGLPSLQSLLTSEYPVIQRLALAALGSLTQESRARKALHDLQSPMKMLDLLKNKKLTDLHIPAMRVLAGCMEEPEVIREMYESDGLETLLYHVNLVPAELQVLGLRAIAHATRDANVCQEFHKRNIEMTLITLLESAKSDEVKTEACDVVTALSSLRASQDTFGNSGMVVLQSGYKGSQDGCPCVLRRGPGWWRGELCGKALPPSRGTSNEDQSWAVPTLATQVCEESLEDIALHRLRPTELHYNLHRAALQPQRLSPPHATSFMPAPLFRMALASLTNDHRENCSLAANDTTSLLALLESSGCLVLPATTVLCNMCMYEGPRTCLQEKGAISALLACLVSADPEIQTSVLQTLAALVCDSKSRAELRAEDHLPLIINLLNSDYKEVYFAACWTVSSCAADESTAQEFCRLGTPVLLSTYKAFIHMLMEYCSPFWDGAPASHLAEVDAVEVKAFNIIGISHDKAETMGLSLCHRRQILHKLNLSKSRCSHFSETAYTKLLDKNLPAKYSFTGHLSSCNFVLDGFYDVGKLRPDTQLPSLEELTRTPLNVHRPTLLINAGPCEEDLTKSKKKENVQLSTKSGESQTNLNQWLPPTDPILQGYITEARTMVQPSMTMQQQIVILARFVSHKMGGPVTTLSEFTWELHCSELKQELNSNVIPIGKIQKGIYYHRALLFKVLADRLAICSTLVRGSYGRAWNEVLLLQENTTCCKSLPGPSSKFIVDLMYNPGELFAANSRKSTSYCRF
uniref:armadillo repeat-containing protein 3-like n=1 Tax=Myxine glutinosa TaxID=7769 RepID=UPI00358EB7ED